MPIFVNSLLLLTLSYYCRATFDENRPCPKIYEKESGTHPIEVNSRELHFEHSSSSTQALQVSNNSTDRFAIKVMCTDNITYRFKPVFSFLEPHGQQEILVTHHASRAKNDYFEIVAIPAKSSDLDAKMVFPADDDAVQKIVVHVALTAA